MGKFFPTLDKWPADKPYPAGAIGIFYDPETDNEYQLDLSRLGGPGSSPEEGGDGKVQASDIEGVFSLEQMPPADDAYINQLYEALKSRLDQRYTQL